MEQFSNLGASRITADMGVGDTTLTVMDASSFPTLPKFRLAIENELLLCTHVSGATFTVQRAIEGTVVAAYSAGTIVRQILTAGALYQLASEIRTPHWQYIPLVTGGTTDPEIVWSPVGGFIWVQEHFV